jgi:hypothetical protein
MEFNAEIIKDLSLDPYFKLVFSYTGKSVIIKRGFAEIVRKSPKSVITFDRGSNEMLSKEDREKLELELLNKVIEYLLSVGVAKSWRGNIILSAV